MEAITADKLLGYCILWRCKHDIPKCCECVSSENTADTDDYCVIYSQFYLQGCVVCI